VLRLFVVLSLPAAALISCATAPSTPDSDEPDRSGAIGELEVFAPFVIAGSTDGSPAPPALPPGRYAARLDKLQRDEIAIDIDAADAGDLTVRLEEDAGEFPVGTGGFSFTASQHDLPYTIHGEHLVTRTVQSSTRFRETCYIRTIREYCYTADDGEVSCSLYEVAVPGWQSFQRRVTLEGENLELTFVDAEAAAVVAQYSAFVEPHLEERITREGACQEYR